MILSDEAADFTLITHCCHDAWRQKYGLAKMQLCQGSSVLGQDHRQGRPHKHSKQSAKSMELLGLGALKCWPSKFDDLSDERNDDNPAEIGDSIERTILLAGVDFKRLFNTSFTASKSFSASYCSKIHSLTLHSTDWSCFTSMISLQNTREVENQSSPIFPWGECNSKRGTTASGLFDTTTDVQYSLDKDVRDCRCD